MIPLVWQISLSSFWEENAKMMKEIWEVITTLSGNHKAINNELLMV